MRQFKSKPCEFEPLGPGNTGPPMIEKERVVGAKAAAFPHWPESRNEVQNLGRLKYTTSAFRAFRKWGGSLSKRFCLHFSESSPCSAWAAWQLQFIPTACGTLRKHLTKPSTQPAAPDCTQRDVSLSNRRTPSRVDILDKVGFGGLALKYCR